MTRAIVATVLSLSLAATALAQDVSEIETPDLGDRDIAPGEAIAPEDEAPEFDAGGDLATEANEAPSPAEADGQAEEETLRDVDEALEAAEEAIREAERDLGPLDGALEDIGGRGSGERGDGRVERVLEDSTTRSGD